VRNNFKKNVRHGAALIICAGHLLGAALCAAEPESQPGYESIRRISSDLRSALATTNRERLLATPVLEKSPIPLLQPGMFSDGTNSWQAVYISNGLVDFLNNLAYAKAVEKEDRAVYMRFLAQLRNNTNGVPEVRTPSEAWSLNTVNHQVSRFNQMAGGLVAVEMAHHYLGHYAKHESSLKAAQKPVPMNTLITPEEWLEAMLTGGRNALNCGLSVAGLNTVLDLFEKEENRPAWAIQFVPPGANLSHARQALTAMERDFFVMDEKKPKKKK
jgi:hypothetical protein